jgi:hypothetical protein
MPPSAFIAALSVDAPAVIDGSPPDMISICIPAGEAIRPKRDGSNGSLLRSVYISGTAPEGRPHA